MQAKFKADAKDIAIEFISLAQSDESAQPLTQMQVQKLVYFAHGWYMAEHQGRPLIGDEVEVWKWGPVIPRLYRMFKAAGAKKIRLAKGLKSDLSDEDKDFVKRVWDRYKKYTAAQMSNLTHKPSTPWSDIVKAKGGLVPSHTAIPNSAICKHFNELREKSPL